MMDEMKLTGNCLKGSRLLLSFDDASEVDSCCYFNTNFEIQKFAETPHFSLLIELFKQVAQHWH